MIKQSRDHLACAKESYAEHFGFAAKVSFRLIFAGAAGIVHALIPAIFTKYTGDTILKLADELKERRAKGTSANKNEHPKLPHA